MATTNYPKNFEIIKNDGNYLEIRIGEIVKGCSHYFYQLSKNGINIPGKKKLTLLDPNFGVIRTDITETGKYTFSIYLNDAEYSFGAPWRIITNPIKKLINWIFKNPVWEQDVFVMVKKEQDELSDKIKPLVEKYAPFLLLDNEERYVPASLDYLVNQEMYDNNLNDLKVGIIFHRLDTDRKKKVTRRTRLTGVVRENIENIPINDIGKVLPFNGDNIGELDTLKVSDVATAKNEMRNAIEKRVGNPDNITVYYSCFFNPNQKRDEVVINYHFLYAYDPKTEKEGQLLKIASHVFDRESISIVFNWDRNNPEMESQPNSVLYGAHLPGQTITLKRNDNGEEQAWSTGRVKLKWEDVAIVKNEKMDKFHPVVAVALGSHAPYPVRGDYVVDPGKMLPSLVEPARAGKGLIPSCYENNKSKVEEVFKSKDVSFYKLADLELGSITSTSKNSILAFSGDVVDIIGGNNAKFPPFTKRETEIDKYVNGTEDDPVHNWDPNKVDKTDNSKFAELVKKIEKSLTEGKVS